MSARVLHWWESEFDAKSIKGNGWQFNIAKVVLDAPNSPKSNVIWQSTGLAPMVNIQWEVDYALNWSAQLPQTGVNVSIGGKWQACAPGQIFDLDANGFWQPSVSPPKANWMGVGNVGYSWPGVTGIHIVVGVKNALTGNYDTIYIDPTALPPNSSATYQPQETVKWWLGGGTSSGSVYSTTQGAVDIKDYTVPAPITNKYEWWTTYTFATGTWVDTQTAPPGNLMVPASRDAEFLPLYRTVVFNIPIEVGLERSTTAYLKAYLGQWYVSVEIDWNDPSNFRIVHGPNIAGADANDLLSQYLATGEEDARINQGLKNAQAANDLPPNATWNIMPASFVDVVEDADEAEDTVQEPMLQTTEQMLPTDFPVRQAKKLAAINNPVNSINGMNPAQRRVGSAQSVSAY